MSYSDVKAAAKDLTKAALNGSPRWRLAVTASVVALSLCAAYGYRNYASAGEVDRKIEDAIKPLKEDIASIKDSVDELSKQTKLSQAILIEGQIHASQRSWCESNRRGQRAPIVAQRIDELKKQYTRLMGEAPYIPTCQQV